MNDENEEMHSGRFSIIPSVALDDPRVTPALLKVLCVIGTYGNKTGFCWLKLRTLAARLKITPQGVSKSLQHLKDLGYIEIIPRKGKDGRQIRNDYRILFDVRDIPENGSQVEGGQPLEVEGGQPLEVEGGQPLEVEALNASSERFNLTLPSAAAISNPTRELVDGAFMPEAAAAAAACNDDDQQTAEALRRHLRMGNDKLPGLVLIVRLYPNRRPWLENEANLCFATLKKRPIGLNHFSNWLAEAERRRTAPREEITHGQPTAETAITAPSAPRLTARERAAEERAAALAAGLGVPEPYDDA